MSDRRLPPSNQRMEAWMRAVEDRLYKLEHGGSIVGRVSFGDTIVIGVVQFQVVPGTAGAVDLVLTNLNTGVTSTINL